MIYGYARVSTKAQAKDGNSLEAQELSLRQAGASVIYKDTFTGSTTNRPEFEKLICKLIPGDTLVVTKLDRVARSAAEGSKFIQMLINRGISVNVLNMGKMDDTPTGKLICTIMFAFAEFERDMIVERTQEGRAIARKHPDFHEGRPRKYTAAQIEHALELLIDHSYSQVTAMTGISKATLVRAKNKSIIQE
ncbi:recombinase family protein [Butyrivibrio sp. WCD3002]|uniref:recombinase family protein n=1 Tax=Butyrivibrio sp. WCD3002 TaxID=1280676 RepID=UPI00041C3589|nr:recombinase family protein [Butyrivibrio sp. WCD3002]